MYSILTTSRIGSVSEERKSAKIRFVHNVPANLSVDIYVDGYLLIADFTFRSTTDFFNITAGTITVEIKISGTSDTVIRNSLTVVAGNRYTLVIHGRTSGASILALEDSPVCPPLDVSRIRIVHAAVDAPMVDVYSNNTALLFRDIRYSSVGNPTYLDVQSGKYKLNIVPSGTSQSVLDINVVFNSEDIYTIVVSGIPGNGQFPLAPIILRDGAFCSVYS
jgi:hypothetical protein